MSGQYSVVHNDFTETAVNTVNKLLTDDLFTDVTIACGGGEFIRAHKVILSSYSTTFKSLFLNIKQQNPMIYLKGVDLQDLRALVEFIYLGKTQIDQDRFERFIEIAQEFNVTGMAEDSEPTETEIDEAKHPDKNDDVVDKKTKDLIKIEQPEENKKTDSTNNVDKDPIGINPECKICEKVYFDKSTLRRHYKDLHSLDAFHCDKCDYEAKSKRKLEYHTKSSHSEDQQIESKEESGITFNCQECGISFRDKHTLSRHLRNLHGSDTIKCDMCNYEVKNPRTMNYHKKSKHSE